MGFGDLWGFDLVVWVAFVGALLRHGGFLGLVFLWFCVGGFLLCCMRRVWCTTLDLLCNAV